MNADRLEIYKKLAERFPSLIPLNGKVPIEKEWQKYCTEPRPFNINDFINHNVGITTGPANGIIVLDVDDQIAFDSYLNSNGLVIPQTRIHQTGGGGYHHFFQHPRDGKKYQNKSFKNYGFDIRADGGQVVGPGSAHPITGRLYIVLIDCEPVPAPDWILTLCREEETLLPAGATVAITAFDWNGNLAALPISDTAKGLIVKGKQRGHRSEAMWRVLHELLKGGATTPNIVKIFEAYAIGEKFRSKGSNREQWLMGEIQQAESKLQLSEKLKLAETPEQYAGTFALIYGFTPKLIPFGRRYCELRTKKVKIDGKEVERQYALRLSNFVIALDHYVRDESDANEPSFKYRFKVLLAKGGEAISCSATGDDLATGDAVTKFFLRKGMGAWEGDRFATQQLVRLITDADAPVVWQLGFQGFDDVSDSYVFKDFGINPNGEVIKPDASGIYKITEERYVRAAPYKHLNPVKMFEPGEICQLLYRAWGLKSLIAVAFMLGSWLVHQIKEKIGFFPFLSLYGPPQTGKSRLTRILNALQCLDEEGVPLYKINTAKGEIRKLSQASGLFKALLEGNKPGGSRFDFDTILPLYNLNPLQIRAVKSNDSQTIEIPFRSSLLFVQNVEPFTTRPQKERIISLPFSTDDITHESTVAFERLINLPPEGLAYFFIDVMAHRLRIQEQWYLTFIETKKEFPQTLSARIVENYALIFTFYKILARLIGPLPDAQQFMIDLANAKERSCVYHAGSIAGYFWECIAQLPVNERDFFLKKGTFEHRPCLFLLLSKAIEALNERKFNIGSTQQIIAELAEHPAFIKSRHSYRGFSGKDGSTKVWVFDCERFDPQDGEYYASEDGIAMRDK